MSVTAHERVVCGPHEHRILVRSRCGHDFTVITARDVRREKCKFICPICRTERVVEAVSNAGRTCSTETCKTVLNSYNRDPEGRCGPCVEAARERLLGRTG